MVSGRITYLFTQLTGLLMLLVLMGTPFAYADTEPVDGSATTGKVAKNNVDNNGVSGSGDTLLPDLFTGTLTHTIPIDVPAGRGNIAPSLALLYRNNNKNGWLGTGWELEVGAIERSSRSGLDYGSDNFTWRNKNSSEDLVRVPGLDNEYRTKIENDFNRFKYFTDKHWEVTDKKGVTYYYGSSSASQLAHPVKGILKWCLDKIKDTNGNEIIFNYELTYLSDGITVDQIYLKNIQYAPAISIKFYSEDRTDITTTYDKQFANKTQKRLKTIEVVANNVPVRAYFISYASAQSTGRSLITNVRQYGKDYHVNTAGDITNAETIVSKDIFRSANYNDADTLSFTQFTNPTGLGTSGWSVGNTLHFVGDFDGDGKSDILKLQIDDNNTLLISNGDGSFTSVIPSDNSSGNALTGLLTNAPNNTPVALAGDFDGIGKTQLLIIRPLSTSVSNIYTYQGEGKFTKSADDPLGKITWSGSVGAGTSFPLIGDFDGDGRTDVLIWESTGTAKIFLGGQKTANPNRVMSAWASAIPLIGNFTGKGKDEILLLQSSGVNYLYTYDNVSATFVKNSDIPGIGNDSVWASSQAKTTSGDFNGDGLTDVLVIDSSTVNSFMYISDGNGGFAKKAITSPGFTTSSCTSAQYYVGDFNDDGKSDVMQIMYQNRSCRSGGGPFTGIDHYLSVISSSNGDGTFLRKRFDNTDILRFANEYDDAGRHPSAILLGDFAGVGKTGILGWCANGAAGNYLYLNKFDQPIDSLKSFRNNLGGTESILYSPSTATSNTLLPFPVWTVTSVTYDDGNGNAATNRISYEKGYYNLLARDFRGFNHATITGPLGPNNEQLTTEVYFHQGTNVQPINNSRSELDIDLVGNMKGKIYLKKVKGPNGYYSATQTTYASAKPNVWFHNPPSKVEDFICDGYSSNCITDSNAIKLKIEYVYDESNSTSEYGNITHEYRYGDTSETANFYTIARTYSPNVNDWIVGTLTSETIYSGINKQADPIDNKVSSVSYFYDDLTNCTSSPAQGPAKGNLTRISRWWDKGSKYSPAITSVESRIAYDSYGNISCTRQGEDGSITDIHYDATNTFPVEKLNAFAQPTSITYYGVNNITTNNGTFGQIETVTDPNGLVYLDSNGVNNPKRTTYIYDNFGRMVLEIFPDAFENTWYYHDTGLVGTQYIYSSNSAGRTITAYLDGFGRIFKYEQNGPDNKTIRVDTDFDNRGGVKRASFPYFTSGETVRYKQFKYDSIGRVIGTSEPGNATTLATTATCYRANSRTDLDQSGHLKRKSFDGFGRLARVEEFTGVYGDPCSTPATSDLYATTNYGYDVRGHLTSVRDAGDLHTTTISYDSLGLKYYTSDPDMGVWQYNKYDKNGNLTLQTDARGFKTAFGYDSLNRIMYKDYGADGNTDESKREVKYFYDSYRSTPPSNLNRNPIGRLTSLTDSSGSSQYFYDIVGRSTGRIKTIDSVDYPISATYELGRLRSITYPPRTGQSVGEVVIYGYDSAGNLSKVGDLTLDNRYATLSKYNAVGQAGTVRYGNGVTTEYGYNTSTDSRLQSIVTNGPSLVPLISLSYLYDLKGNVKSITDSLNYDTSIPLRFTGNSYTLFPGKAHATGSTNLGRVFDYDENGNMKFEDSRKFVYDYENLPVTIGDSSFVYDGNGERVKKIYNSNGNWATKVYLGKLFDCETSAYGSWNNYIFAGNRLIAQKGTAGTYFFHQDHLGSNIVVTNSSGIQQGITYQYFPFGEGRNTPNNDQISHRYFTGQEYDFDTRFYNYNARLYDPDTGKFISSDNVISDFENPQSLNKYSYVMNNPSNMADPSGHTPEFTTPGGSNGGGNSGGGNIGGGGGAGVAGGDGTGDIGQDFKEFGQMLANAGVEIAKGFREAGRAIRRLFHGRSSTPPPPPVYASSTMYAGFGKAPTSQRNLTLPQNSWAGGGASWFGFSNWLIPDVTMGLDSPIGGVNTTLPFRNGGIPVTVQASPSYNYPVGPGINMKTHMEMNTNVMNMGAVGNITTPILGLEGSIDVKSGNFNNPSLLGPQLNFPLLFGSNLYIQIKW